MATQLVQYDEWVCHKCGQKAWGVSKKRKRAQKPGVQPWTVKNQKNGWPDGLECPSLPVDCDVSVVTAVMRS